MGTRTRQLSHSTGLGTESRVVDTGDLPRRADVAATTGRHKRLMRTLLLAVAVVTATSLVLSAQASASPEAHWRANGPGTTTVLTDRAAATAQMTYDLDSPDVSSTQTWTFSTRASRDGLRNLDFDYRGFHAFFDVRVFLEAFVTHRGVTTSTPLVSAGPGVCCAPPSGGFDYQGSVSLDVRPGDTYGFRFGGSNFDDNHVLSGTLTVSSQPQPSDE